MKKQKRALVTGAGGFVGSHLEKLLKEKGYWVRSVDLVRSRYWDSAADEFLILDLRQRDNCLLATEGVEEVYSLAANMGGIGFITTVKAPVMHDNVLINIQMLDAARKNRVDRYFYSSSACVYPTFKQDDPSSPALKEDDAYPSDPDNEYGWEKLYTERVCTAYREEYGLDTHVARFHNCYGPYGAWIGGREKAPAAICRKVAETPDGGSMEIWGDGKQTRSFMHVRDCVEGIHLLTQSSFHGPVNIGSDELVTIDELADMAIACSGKKITKIHNLDKPQGVRGRNSDNSLIQKVLGWTPSIKLKDGLAETYPWIADLVKQNTR